MFINNSLYANYKNIAKYWLKYYVLKANIKKQSIIIKNTLKI